MFLGQFSIPVLLLCANILYSVPSLAASSKCYSSIPSSYGSGKSYTYQSSGYCKNQCSSYSYYALHDGNLCYCGNEAPSSDDETDDSDCDSPCSGYDKEDCGGSSAYQVYTLKSSSSDSSSTTSSSSSTDDSSSTSATATTTHSKTSSSSQSTYVQLVTLMATQSGGGTHVVTVTAAHTAVATSVVSGNSDSGNSQNKAKLIGPIVGGVIGGLAALSILALVIFFIRRQRQKDRDLLDADANIIATMKRNENSTHTRQLSNPFADDFVDPPQGRSNSYMEASGYDGSTTRASIDDGHDFYNPNNSAARPKLAVVNPDKD